MPTPAAVYIRSARSPAASERDDRNAHVLFLIDELRGKGGTESALLNTVRWLPRRFRTTVVTFRCDSSLPLLAEFPIPVITFPLRRTYDWTAFQAAVELARFIKTEGVDIVHTFFPSSDLWGGMIAKFSRTPALISSRRDMGIVRRPMHRIAYRVLRGMFDCVLANSEAVRKYSIEQDRLDPTRVKTIYNGLDMASFCSGGRSRRGLARFGLESASHVVTTLGNVRRVKGFDIFIEAAALVCRRFPAAVFVIAGANDPREPDLRRELEDLGLLLGIAGNIRFLGGVSDVSSLLTHSDVFCLLSRSEGFSNALIEAMACGTPCIATRVGGNSEAIAEGQSGFLIEKENPVSAAEKILELLENSCLARAVGDRARSRVMRHFSSASYVSELVSVYDRLLASRN